MPQSIRSGSTFDSLIPALTDNADIVKALKDYHYGVISHPTTQEQENSLTTGIVGLFNSKAVVESPTFTGTVVLPSTTSIGNVSSTELGYLDGVTSSIQTQITNKANSLNPTFTGNVTLPTGTNLVAPIKFVSGVNLTTPVSGSLEYDGTVFYQTSSTNPGRALSTQDYYYVSNSTYDLDLSTSGLSRSLLGANSRGITLSNGTTYSYELFFAMRGTYFGDSQTPSLSIFKYSGDATIAHTSILETGSNTTGFTTATTLTSTYVTSSQSLTTLSSGSRYYIVKMSGTIRVTGSGVAKIFPAISVSTSAPDPQFTIQSGLSFRLTPIGNGTVTSVGTWS